MGRDARKKKRKNDEDKERPKGSDFKAFLKKRAPIYLGVIALFLVFVIPELTKGDLQGSLPELSAGEQQAADIIMEYDGPNKTGLSVMDAITDEISETYPNEKIFDNKKTSVSLTVSDIDDENRHVVFNFQSHKGEIRYDWNVNINSGEITPNDPESEYIIDLVDYYD